MIVPAGRAWAMAGPGTSTSLQGLAGCKMAATPTRLDGKTRRLVETIVEHVKSQGIFDQFRRECLEELDQKEPYRQLKQRVESHVATFLSKQTWTDSLPKNQVRNSLRCNINQSDILQRGVERLINQTIDQKSKSFQTRIEGVVQNYLYESNREKRERYRRPIRVSESKSEAKPSVSEAVPSSYKSDISQLLPSMPVTTSLSSTTAKSEPLGVTSIVQTPTSHSRLQSHGSAHSPQSLTVLTATTSIPPLPTSNVKQDSHPVVSNVQIPVNNSSVSTSQHCGVAALKSEVRTEDNAKCLSPESQKVSSVQRRPSPVLGKKAQQVKTKHSSPSPLETFVPSSRRPQSPSESTREHSSPRIRDEKVKKSSSVAMLDETPLLKPSHDRDLQMPDPIVERAKLKSYYSDSDKEETTGNSNINETLPEPSNEEEIAKTVDMSELEKVSKEAPIQTSINVAQDLNTIKTLEVQVKLEEDTETATKLALPSDSDSHAESKQSSVCGEDSLAESDISEISSVHTSDLSSFDEDVSSVSSLESENEGGEEKEIGRDRREDDSIEHPAGVEEPNETNVPSPTQEGGSAAEEEPASALRRSRRISTRRSTKEEDTDDPAEQERKELDSQSKARKKALREKYASTLSRRRQNRESGLTSCEQTSDPNVPAKRRRGRPRKEERQHRAKSTSRRESRRSVYESSEEAIRSEGATGEPHVRHRSKRTVKRTRCYSPSSEGTREISLPSKRTRPSRD